MYFVQKNTKDEIIGWVDSEFYPPEKLNDRDFIPISNLQWAEHKQDLKKKNWKIVDEKLLHTILFEEPPDLLHKPEKSISLVDLISKLDEKLSGIETRLKKLEANPSN